MRKGRFLLNIIYQRGVYEIMKRAYLNYFLLGILVFLLLAGVSSYPVNAEASPFIKMNPGQSKKMILPKRWKHAKWSSSKKAIARINSKGVVKAVAPGKAVITAKSGKGTKKYRIKVQLVQLDSSQITMRVGETKKLTAKNALGKVSWSSDGEAVKVDSKGKITAVKAGKAVITATVFKKKYKCTVTVEYEKIKDSEKVKDSEKMKIQVGDTTFTVTLAENSSVDALKELMAKGPLTLNMSDYANMEKGADLGVTLPQNNEQMNTQAGDVILYQGRTIVIYYDTNSWRLTPIGKIDNVDPEKLRTVLGAGDVTVTLSLE